MNQPEPNRIPNLRRRLKLSAHSARKAATPAVLFAAWAVLSLLGPELRWTELDRWEVMLACTIGYGLLTAGAMGALMRGASAVSLDPELRHVFREHLVPFWMIAMASLGVGAVTFLLWPGVIVALWLGVGATLWSLLMAFTAARVIEIGKLRRKLWRALKAPKAPRTEGSASTTIQTWPSISMGQ